MTSHAKRLWGWGIVLAIAVVALGWMVASPRKPGPLDAFAQCLKAKGATFYGAFWCPHCQREKGLFGSSAALLPYVECATADAQGQTQVCIDKKITGYPTWEFADGSRETGETSLTKLAEKTGCGLPQ